MKIYPRAMGFHLKYENTATHSVTCHLTQVNTPHLNPSQRLVLKEGYSTQLNSSLLKHGSRMAKRDSRRL